MNYLKFVENMDKQTIDNLQTAIETGVWQDGQKLSEEQRNSAMQALILWQAKHASPDVNEPFRIARGGDFYVGKGKTGQNAVDQMQADDESTLKNSSALNSLELIAKLKL